MKDFKMKKISFQVDDKGITVGEVFSLVASNPLAQDLSLRLNISEIQHEMIEIPGAAKLVCEQMKINERFAKVDHECDLSDISLYDEDDFTINFENADRNPYFAGLEFSRVVTEPIYSSQTDLFSGLCNMDKFVKSLAEEGHKEIVLDVYSKMQTIKNPHKIYRILIDQELHKCYLRAIVSDKYNNYDNNMAIFIALVSLHNQMKETGVKYSLDFCELNESYINMYFETSEVYDLEDVGKVRNVIQVSNDEIKREALKFSCVAKIYFDVDDPVYGSMYLTAENRVKSTILTIKHNVVPKTAVIRLSELANTGDIYKELFSDVAQVKKVRNVDQIKFILIQKIEKATRDSIKPYKASILKELDNDVRNIHELLTLFKKVELLAGEDIEATQFIRYMIYEVLISKRKSHRDKEDESNEDSGEMLC